MERNKLPLHLERHFFIWICPSKVQRYLQIVTGTMPCRQFFHLKIQREYIWLEKKLLPIIIRWRVTLLGFMCIQNGGSCNVRNIKYIGVVFVFIALNRWILLSGVKWTFQIAYLASMKTNQCHLRERTTCFYSRNSSRYSKLFLHIFIVL